MKIPRILITAASSGSGKTLISCGLLQAIVNRNMNVAAFKCGPDYIDAMFHEKIIGASSRNLDLFLTGKETMRHIFGTNAKDAEISFIEGVMGFYDGQGATAIEGSSYMVSQELDSPVIFVADGGVQGLSLVPVIKGFAEFKKNNIKGVILNNVHETVYPELKEIVERETKLKVLGYLPNVKELVIGSRHLGLIMPNEIDMLKEKMNRLAEIMERTIDIDEVIRIADAAPDFAFGAPELGHDKVKVRIAMARDDAFCFIYKDNIDLLERLGAEIAYFSPLSDEHLPKDIGGIIIPGGYPELCAYRLSKNRSILKEIKESTEKGMPCIAEAGGFMYLHDEIEDEAKKFHKMAGVVKGNVHKTDHLVRFGYITVTSEKDGLMSEGMKLRGHEFHYWESTNYGNDCDASRPAGGKGYRCMHIADNLFIGFPQLHYCSNPDFVHRFLKKCDEYLRK